MSTTHDVLSEAFLKRSIELLRRMAAQAPSEVLSNALAEPSSASGLAYLLSDLSPIGIDIETIDPLASAMARGVRAKETLIEQAGGAWSAATAAAALGISRQAVDKRRRAGHLLAVRTGADDYLYPRCQFRKTGVVEGLDAVLEAFTVEEPWVQLAVLTTPSEALGGKTVFEALKQGKVAAAVQVVQRYGEQGA
jgi:hypothetical protein